MTRRYSELERLETFEERFDYLKIGGEVGESTFGFDRWINQDFYRSREWKQVREFVIVRDDGCDLGIPDRQIHTDLLVHHMNPMVSDDIIHGKEWILDPEFLITTTQQTHNDIHYGRESPRPLLIKRSHGDTKLW